MYYDRTGQPMSREQWAQRMDDLDYKRVAETAIEDEYWISTVWIGLDLSSLGVPLIFETMVFARGVRAAMAALGGSEYSQWHEYDCERYATEEEAMAGHAAMVEKWRGRQ